MEKLHLFLLVAYISNVSCYYYQYNYDLNFYNPFKMCYAATRYGVRLVPCSALEHVGTCPILEFCPFKFPYSYTSFLRCCSDLDCPATHKCCVHLCYRHKVCLAANVYNPPRETEPTTPLTVQPTTPLTVEPTKPTWPTPTTEEGEEVGNEVDDEEW